MGEMGFHIYNHFLMVSVEFVTKLKFREKVFVPELCMDILYSEKTTCQVKLSKHDNKIIGLNAINEGKEAKNFKNIRLYYD